MKFAADEFARKVGSSRNADDSSVNTQRQAWSVQIPSDGEYRATARGAFLGAGIDPELWFGHGPPLSGALVPIVAAGLVLISGLLFFFIAPRIRGRPQRAATRSGTFTPSAGKPSPAGRPRYPR